MNGATPNSEAVPELTFVIPVYNARLTIEAVVREIFKDCGSLAIEVVLVNDGSTDDTEAICRRLADEVPERIVFVQMARNFGEHPAVLAGLRYARGEYVAVVDDDGQHPPAEAVRLYREARERNLDVVYGRYAVKHHGSTRNFGSWLHNQLATRMLMKPPGLYLSSFKVMNRFVVDSLCRFENAPAYIDGLIFRVTRNVGEIEVTHRPRFGGESNYRFWGLVKLWLGIFLDFSTLPLRIVGLLGLFFTCASSAQLLLIAADLLWIGTEIPVGIPTVICIVILFGGIQLVILWVIGEYLGRLFMARSGGPPFVIRYAMSDGHRLNQRGESCPHD